MESDESQLELQAAIRMLLEGRGATPGAGAVRCVEVSCGPGGTVHVAVDAPRPRLVLLPGSFNPLHEGHRRLLAAGAAAAGMPPRAAAFELCVRNADKGDILVDELKTRIDQFIADGSTVVLSRATLFTDKARLFRAASFVVGHDTARRILMPKYYDDDVSSLAAACAVIRASGCRFVVGGRVDPSSGKYLTLDDVDMPEAVSRLGLFTGIPEHDFRVDISSTELRETSSRKDVA